MKRIFRLKNLTVFFVCSIVLSEFSCHTQTNNSNIMDKSNQKLITREPVVAGQFYPGSPSELRNELEGLFKGKVSKTPDKNILAIISPHAGYVYSGNIAAESFAQIDPEKGYDNIFLIGSSHHLSFDGASIYTKGNFSTPLGIVPVNLELARKLATSYGCFTERTDAHIAEHSLEVQLPFLQYRLKNPYRIIPIVIASQNATTCRKIADALKPFFIPSNLFIISTDLSHYPSYEDAKTVDKNTLDAILTNDPDKFLKVIDKNNDLGIKNLATSICGWTSVLTLMYITEKIPGLTYHLIDYKNSGDARYYGDKSRVVGYGSISVSEEATEKTSDQEKSSYQLSATDKERLLIIARETINAYVKTGKVPDIKEAGLSSALLTPAGAFVTLHKQGKLRGCIGRFNPDIPLYKVVQEMAISSAVKDYRFSPVKPDEIDDIKIEISILTPLKRIYSSDEIKLGQHGIYITKGSRSGTFLPQVANNTNWTVEEFLGTCSRDKAGIGWDGWKTAELYTYEAIVFEEH
jgi:AmmeMemoRadiSam system protein B/AmmeMemoRadiSam system protein A